LTVEDAMAKGLTPFDLHKLARVGAAARLAELEREIGALRKAFPGLKAEPAAAAPPGPAPASQTKLSSRPSAKRGRRKPMSAAERKAVSERMKRYWADRRQIKR
jgi:hypothetical protein